MRVWLINPYGPIRGEGWRDYRFVMLGDALARAGHDCVWWTSNFSHHFKRFRSAAWADIQVRDGFVIRLVPTTGYKSNVSAGRVLRDAVFAWRTYRRGRVLDPPDCVFYSESPLCLGFAGQKLAAHHGVPVVFDQMDLWPELFEPVFPKWSRALVRLALAPIYESRRRVYERLDAVVSLAGSYLEVPLREAPALQNRPHGVFYNGIDVVLFRALMNGTSVGGDPWPAKGEKDVWAVFAGSLGVSYDIGALIEAARRTATGAPNLRIIVAGDGPLRPDVEAYAGRSGSNLSYTAALRTEDLCRLYRQCDIGLCTYSARSNVEMPDKFYDYTAAGLAVINSLPGDVRRVIQERGLGLQYRAGDGEDLANALASLVSDAQARRRMAHSAFEVGMTYDRHVQYGALVQFLVSLCGGEARREPGANAYPHDGRS